ncbi:Oidioi.mRNA.OKI2018_I69.XSR.g16213.t1.cds [Oikopleura dioica]|uniref:Oidioi.mRNA.OKI2018_I69.XSR.g16213.t1.cds n=1 Tax=Oikopleura dioica TaxID=34765 RepID=A0ABN7SFC2_OIKDI|nr:Oidioi.mRNA.OKI2018_I69.XSR.g16213.t1.cds [Oikopleura dioica]
MITEEEIIKEGERIIAEFGEYAREFSLKDSFYHGKFGRCLRFYVKTLEEQEYRLLFHRNGVLCLTNSMHFESFEQFFNSLSPAFRDLFGRKLQDKLQNLVIK